MGGIPFELGADIDSHDPRELGGVPPRRRSLWAVGALAIGFSLARGWEQWGGQRGGAVLPTPPSAALWFAASQGVLALVLLTRGARCRALLFVACVLFAGAWYSARFRDAPANRLDRLLAPEIQPGAPLPVVTVLGRVLDAPHLAESHTGVLGRFARAPSAWVFQLHVDALESGDASRDATGILRVSVHAPENQPPPISPGARVRVTGQFGLIPPPFNPGEPDRRLLAIQDGVVGRLSVPSESLIETIDAPAGVAGPWDRFVAWSRARATAAIGPAPQVDRAHAESGRALLVAMLLGTREPGMDEVDAAFRRIGLVHLVAISGFNLGVLAWAAGLLLRFAGDRGRLESAGIAGVIALYLLVVPAESPILRAGVSVLAFLATEMLGRRYDRLTLLGWIAVALLLWRPLDLWSLGFQLSFGIVGALLWLAPHVEARLFGVPLRGVVSVGIPIGERPGLLLRGVRAARRLFLKSFKTAFSASLLAWGVAAPVIIVHTGVLSPWAPLTGLVALPIAIVTLCAGYVVLMVGFAWPAAGTFLAPVAIACADVLARLVMTLDDIPGASIQLPHVSALWGAAAVGVVLYWFARGRRRSPLAWTLAAIVAAWLGAELYSNSRLPASVPFRVDTIAVGDGTCHLVRSGSDAMLWDCGSSHPGMGLLEIPRAVRALGAWHVPAVLVTHPNLDHYLCLPDLVEPLHVRRVYLTKMFLAEAAARPRGAPAAFIHELESRGVTIVELHTGSTIQLGAVRCDILNPDADAAFTEDNDTSLVGLFHVPTDDAERRVLLDGDIGPAAINSVSAKYSDLSVDVMEVPHHGSAKPESMSFVQRLHPKVVLQSTGPQRVGDRRWDAAKRGRAWHVTATDGACWAEVRRDGSVRSGALRADSSHGTVHSSH